jgi:signal peptidase I
MTEIDPSPRPSAATQDHKRRSRGVGLFVRDIVVIFVAAIIISVGIKTFLIRSFYIPSGSMQSTLEENDRIIVNQLVPDVVPLSRGDVVVFRDPGGWLGGNYVEPPANPVAGAIDWVLTVVGLSATDTNDHLIKRVIGLPGDTVVCCNAVGQMEVNGIPLDEPYVRLPDGVTKVALEDFSVTVPEDSLWVMGDNRYNSQDSRYQRDKPGNGFVPIDNVVGRAFVITWPADHWGWLDDYPDTFRGVGDAQ